MSPRKTFFTVLAALSIFLTSNVAARSQAPAPQEIVKKMAEKYAALASYQDSGVVESASDKPLPRRGTVNSFKTYFTRPNKLRFEWIDYQSPFSDQRNLIWSDGLKAVSVHAYEPGKIETKEDIASAVAGATGVSRGAAFTIPNLLISEIGGFSLTELTKLSVKKQEVFEDENCYLIEGYHPNGEAWQLWISTKDFLLRKLRHTSLGDEFEEEIHRDIKVDEKIADTIYQPKMVNGRITDAITKEKESDIRALLELVVPRDRMNQRFNDLLGLLKVAMPQVPEKTWQEVFAEVRFDSNMMLEVYVPLYDWHYTHDEIKQLIKLYESPLGRKLGNNSEFIELQATRSGEKMGEELIKRVQEKLKAKGYKSAA